MAHHHSKEGFSLRYAPQIPLVSIWTTSLLLTLSNVVLFPVTHNWNCKANVIDKMKLKINHGFLKTTLLFNWSNLLLTTNILLCGIETDHMLDLVPLLAYRTKYICVSLFKASLSLGQCFPTPHILCCEEASSFVLKCLAASWSGSQIAELLNGWFVLTQGLLF